MATRGISVAGLLGLFALAPGCASLPSSGPNTAEVVSQAASDTPLGGYVLLDVDERIASISASQPRKSFRRVFSDVGPAPDLRIGVSDSVVVTIWEAGAGGLFSAAVTAGSISSGSRTATIPEQVVARDGTIEVPYAGRLRVAGLRPAEVEQLVVRSLQGKAIEPQAVVTISKNLSNTVTLGGEVAVGTRVPLSSKGDRLLDVIAGAGGIRISTHEAFIRLTRRKHTVSVAYNALLNHPEENIYVLPGDVITVVRDPQTFTAFGATGRSEKVAFDTAGITRQSPRLAGSSIAVPTPEASSSCGSSLPRWSPSLYPATPCHLAAIWCRSSTASIYAMRVPSFSHALSRSGTRTFSTSPTRRPINC
jgi:polysaccharide biosynthesis/export protein